MTLQIGLAIVDDCRQRVPTQLKDQFGEREEALDKTRGEVEERKLIGSASQLVVEEAGVGAGPGDRKRSLSHMHDGFKSIKESVQRR